MMAEGVVMASVNNLAGVTCDVIAGALEWSGKFWRRQATAFYQARRNSMKDTK